MDIVFLAQLLTIVSCAAIGIMATVGAIRGDKDDRRRQPYLEQLPYPVYPPDYEFSVAPVCAPVRSNNLTGAYLADDDEIVVGQSDEVIVGWELSEVER